MQIAILILAAYGLAFLVQNKLPRPDRLPDLVSRLLRCIYCLGFWCGLLVYGLYLLVHGRGDLPLPAAVLDTVVFGFASSVTCYGLDTVVQWFEARD